jgi:hypothetical protein
MGKEKRGRHNLTRRRERRETKARDGEGGSEIGHRKK